MHEFMRQMIHEQKSCLNKNKNVYLFKNNLKKRLKMGKFSRDLDEDLVKKAKGIISEMGISTYVNVDPIALKSKKEIGCVVKANEIAALYTGDDSLVVLALNEAAFRRVDEQTQEIWIRSLLDQIEYDIDKDKINIKKPELQVPLGLYHKFKNVAIEKLELALLTLQQIADEEEQMKATSKKKKK